LSSVKRTTIRQYENDIIRKMTTIGIYREEFEQTIYILAKMLREYDETERNFEDTGGRVVIKYTNKAGATNATKNPYYLALESLRVSILEYLKELGLTPAALKKINEASLHPKRNSALVDALLSFGSTD
jgi:hypothetical protein